MSGYIHASALILGEHGVLVRGAAGSGKSRLVLALLALASARGLFARLVGDDRIGLQAVGGRLLARPHPAIAGQIEQRGTGILALAHESKAILSLVVDLAPAHEHPPRLPDETDAGVMLEGIGLPMIALSPLLGGQEAAEIVLAALRRKNLTLSPE